MSGRGLRLLLAPLAVAMVFVGVCDLPGAVRLPAHLELPLLLLFTAISLELQRRHHANRS